MKQFNLTEKEHYMGFYTEDVKEFIRLLKEIEDLRCPELYGFIRDGLPSQDVEYHKAECLIYLVLQRYKEKILKLAGDKLI